MTNTSVFFKSIWGGMVLGFAGIASAVAAGSGPAILKPLIFPLGLTIIVLAGFQLFTGNVYNFYMRREAAGKTIVFLFVSWIGNLLGSVFASILYAIPAADFGLKILRNTGAMKAGIPLTYAFIAAIACNFLVCLAIHLYKIGDSPLAKIVGVFAPVFLFVALGFEHVVADMVYFIFFPMSALFPFFAVVTLGNLIGGYMLCFAVESSKT